jgi:hypothetical protein
MRNLLILSALALLVGCQPAEPATNTDEASAAPEESAGSAAPAAEAEAEAEPAAENEAAAEAPAADTIEGGVLTSSRFNVRLQVGDNWQVVESDGQGGPAGLGTSDDSLTLVHTEEQGLRIVLGNSESIQLVDTSFSNLTEDIGFDNVRIVPDASQQRTFNGIPGYRTEADALLRGDAVPVYLIAQALDLPARPTMITMFIPGDRYYLFSDQMKAILDSVEALNLRPE